jgi:hypothetical protein
MPYIGYRSLCAAQFESYRDVLANNQTPCVTDMPAAVHQQLDWFCRIQGSSTQHGPFNREPGVLYGMENRRFSYRHQRRFKYFNGVLQVMSASLQPVNCNKST